MPRIMTLCPSSGGLVPTGHRTSTVHLASLIEPRSFRCPACGVVHSWRAEQAVIENQGGGRAGPSDRTTRNTSWTTPSPAT